MNYFNNNMKKAYAAAPGGDLLTPLPRSAPDKTPNSCPQLYQILTDFHIFFTDGLRSKFSTKSCLNIPPCLKHIAFLTSKMLISPDKLNNLCITDRNCY